MEQYALLDQVDEGWHILFFVSCGCSNSTDALHGPRLLNFEEKHFKRLTKRLLAAESLLASSSQLASATQKTGADSDAEDVSPQDELKDAKVQQWKEDTLLDFAQFDSNVIRAQLILNSNEHERRRYAEEKLKIQDTRQAVMENNSTLHDQLAGAQRTLEARKGYDKLTEKITSNRALRTREEQHVQLETLRREIAELQAESQVYARTWAERRDQFGRIVDEGTQLLRLIRDEKEEAERKEGMDDMSDGESTPARGTKSGAGTPAGDNTPVHVPTADGSQSPLHGSKLRDHTVPEDSDPVNSSVSASQTARGDRPTVPEAETRDETMIEDVVTNEDSKEDGIDQELDIEMDER